MHETAAHLSRFCASFSIQAQVLSMQSKRSQQKNTFGLTRATASRCKARQRANFFLPCCSRSKVDNSGINPKGPGMAFWAQHPQQPVWPRKKNEKFITKLHPSPSHAPKFSSHLTVCSFHSTPQSPQFYKQPKGH